MDADATSQNQMEDATVNARKKAGAADEFLEIIKTIVYALLIALVLRVLLFQPFTIPSGSMLPTLHIGDYIIVTKYSYGYSKHSIPFSPPLFDGRIMGRDPVRGDIVVFKNPQNNRQDYIKRLIGLPGDRIRVTEGVLYINEQPVEMAQVTDQDEAVISSGGTLIRETLPNDRSYITQDSYPSSMGDNTGVYVVPEGHYFFMGDNRDNSSDSRFPVAGNQGIGFVPAENLVGKAHFILFSWEGAKLYKPWTWFTKARPGRFFQGLY